MQIHSLAVLFGIGLVVWGSEVPAAAGVPSRPDWFSQKCAMGIAAGTAGDVNGDGYDDAIVVSGGIACVYHGSAQGLSHKPNWVVPVFSEFFEASGGTAGDVNGDGYDDVIVGSPAYGNDDNGRVDVYYGSASGLSKEPDWTKVGERITDYFGDSVGTAGDVDGDGYDEVIVGTSHSVGNAYVYRGSPNGLGAAPIWSVGFSQLHTYVVDAATAGDVNGDGYDDLILGANEDEVEEVGEDQAFVYYGSPGGLSEAPDWVSDGVHTSGFGWSVGSAGDVNDDGYDEVIIGTFYYADHDLERAYLYQGSAAGLGTGPAWTFVGVQGYSGNAVGTAGDVNGDGFDDIIVGAALSDNPQHGIGEAYGFYGSASGPRPSPDWIVRGNQSDAQVGMSVGTAGDTNDDGYDDVIIGAYLYTGVYYHLGAHP